MIDLIDGMLNDLFGIVRMMIRLAPLGTLGAMAFTVGKYGFGVLASLGRLVAAIYFTNLAFVVVILGAQSVVAWRLSGLQGRARETAPNATSSEVRQDVHPGDEVANQGRHDEQDGKEG